MRSKRKEKKERRKATMLAIVYAVVVALFFVTVFRLNVLPMTYFLVLFVAVMAISVPVVLSLLKT